MATNVSGSGFTPKSFSQGVDISLVGTGVASTSIERVDSTIQLLLDWAEAGLQNTYQLSNQLADFEVDKVNYTVSTDDTGQLETFLVPAIRPEQSEIEYELDIKDVPDPGSVDFPETGDVPDLDVPPLDTFNLNLLFNKVYDMLNGQGLPDSWHDSVYQRSADQLWQQQTAAASQIMMDASRGGWAMPQGVELNRKDESARIFATGHVSIQRDIHIKRYEEALADVRLAVQAGIEILKAWIDAFEAEARFLASYDTRKIAVMNGQIALVNAELETWREKFRLDDARVQLEFNQDGQDISVYGTDAGISDAISRRDAAKFQLETDRRSMTYDKQIQQNDANIANQVSHNQIVSSRDEVIAQVQASVTAAVLQAISVRAGMDTGTSYNNGTSWGGTMQYREDNGYSFSESA